MNTLGQFHLSAVHEFQGRTSIECDPYWLTEGIDQVQRAMPAVVLIRSRKPENQQQGGQREHGGPAHPPRVFSTAGIEHRAQRKALRRQQAGGAPQRLFGLRHQFADRVCFSGRGKLGQQMLQNLQRSFMIPHLLVLLGEQIQGGQIVPLSGTGLPKEPDQTPGLVEFVGVLQQVQGPLGPAKGILRIKFERLVKQALGCWEVGELLQMAAQASQEVRVPGMGQQGGLTKRLRFGSHLERQH